MIKVGLVGIGFMGWIHWLAYQRTRGIKVAGIATRNKKRRAGDWRGIQGNFGPPGEKVDLSGVASYEKLDQLLADPDIDLIDLCLPPHLHVEASLKALKAGKHVLCEKPMALTVADCHKMVSGAKRYRKQLLIGHVLPFFPEYAHARKLIDSGRYGKLLGGHFKRTISDPSWMKGFFDPKSGGGPLIDLHVHDAHLIRLLMGMPTSVVSRGRMRGKVVEYCETLFTFKNKKLVVSAGGGVVNQQGRPFTHAFEIHLEKATLHYDFAAFSDGMELMPLKVIDNKGKVIRPDLGDGDPVLAFIGEMKEVAASIRSKKTSKILSGELARDAIILCQKQTESVIKGRPIKI